MHCLHHCMTYQVSGGVERPGIVHRLDKGTSGVLVVAKTDVVHRKLSLQLEKRTITRQYVAVVCGVPDEITGTIDAQIARSRKDRRRMTTVNNNGRRAVTHYQVLEIYHNFFACSTNIRNRKTSSNPCASSAYRTPSCW